MPCTPPGSHSALNREALAGFSDAEAAQFVGLLTRLIGNLDRMAVAEA